MESSHIRSKTITAHNYTKDESETPFTTYHNRNLRLLSALKKKHFNSSVSNSCYFSHNLKIEGHSRLRADQQDKPLYEKDKEISYNVKKLPIPGYSRLLSSLRVRGSRYNPLKTVYKPSVLEASFTNKKIPAKETFSPSKYDISNPFSLNHPNRENTQTTSNLKRIANRRHISELFPSNPSQNIEKLPLVCSVSPSMLEYKLYKVR